MIERVAEVISRYSMFAPGQSVGIAVSGGADSVALLEILLALAPRWDLQLCVLHLNHQLRGEESDKDAAFVASLAHRHALPFRIKELNVRQAALDAGDNLEQAARKARYQFFGAFLSGGAVDRVATGHTRTDQAETVLFRLLRGCGPTGLAGILPVTPEGHVRPLLAVDRADVEAFLRAGGIPWREDSTNRELHHARNRIRHELLPRLARDWNPAITETLANLADLSHAEEVWWRGEMERLARAEFVRGPAGILLRCSRLRDLPEALARRLVRRAVREAKGDLRGIHFRHVEEVLSLARSPSGGVQLSLPELIATRSFDWLRLAPPRPQAPENYRFPLSAPGEVEIPGAGVRIRLDLVFPGGEAAQHGYNTNEGNDLDQRVGSAKLELRNWRPGERFRPAGHAKAEKLKVLFQKARIPSWERARWPMITIGDTIVWAASLGVAEGFTPQPGAERVLRVSQSGREAVI